MSTELTTTENGALIVTNEQMDLVRKTIAPDATPEELSLYLYDCKRQNVHPLDRLLHFTKRGGRYTPITSIDLMRARASDTGELAGSDDAVFEYSGSATPDSAKVTVYRLVAGQRYGFTATARWVEYYPGDGPPGFMWRKLSHVMLSKCAEALALRKAFPRQLAGVYSREEMDQAGIPAPASVHENAPPASAKAVSSVQTPQGEAQHPQTPKSTPAPSAAPPATKAQRIEAFMALLEKNKAAFLLRNKAIEGYVLEYFKSLPTGGLMPHETMEDLNPGDMFLSAKLDATAEENQAAIRADYERHMAGIKSLMNAENQIPGAEVPEPEEAHHEEPQEKKPFPPGTTMKRIRVVAAGQQEGRSNKGPWTRYWVKDGDGQYYSTFDRTTGLKGQTLKDQDAEIWFTEGEKGNTFVEIGPVGVPS